MISTFKFERLVQCINPMANPFRHFPRTPTSPLPPHLSASTSCTSASLSERSARSALCSPRSACRRASCSFLSSSSTRASSKQHCLSHHKHNSAGVTDSGMFQRHTKEIPMQGSLLYVTVCGAPRFKPLWTTQGLQSNSLCPSPNDAPLELPTLLRLSLWPSPLSPTCLLPPAPPRFRAPPSC